MFDHQKHYAWDGFLYTGKDLDSLGFVQHEDETPGFLLQAGSSEYAEEITHVRAVYSSVDGGRFTKVFKSLPAARAWKDREFPNGPVSDDGVQRFDGFQCRLCDGKSWFSLPVRPLPAESI
jgi:hypothetical protein